MPPENHNFFIFALKSFACEWESFLNPRIHVTHWIGIAIAIVRLFYDRLPTVWASDGFDPIRFGERP